MFDHQTFLCRGLGGTTESYRTLERPPVEEASLVLRTVGHATGLALPCGTSEPGASPVAPQGAPLTVRKSHCGARRAGKTVRAA